ncbi:MAG: SpoIIE family protein phosphatase [Kiritimatiellaeota bacterium]|nr:SpoIIE family protein phosphatase [Kiritimatiellota bacterium]
MEPGEIRSLCIRSTLAGVRRAACFCRNACSGLLADPDCHDVELAITEACNNIVRHAYRGAADQPVWLSIQRRKDCLYFRIEDCAPISFQIDEVGAPPLRWDSLADVPEGGWGVFLIRSTMDEVRHTRQGDRNRLELVKRLPEELHQAVAESGAVAERDHSPEAVTALREKLATSEWTVGQMAEELSAAYESLNMFYTLSQDVSALVEEDVLLANVLSRTLECAQAKWGVLRLLTAKGLELRAAHGTETPPPASLSLDEAGIEQKVARTGLEAMHFLDDGTPVVCLPIKGRETLLGTLLLGGSDRPSGFVSGEVKVAQALADQTGVGLENQRLYDQVVRTQLAQREIEIARNLQRRLYPTDLPEIPGLRVETEIETARQVGGDYIGFHVRGPRTLDFVMADAMGKGMSAAFFSIIAHMAFRSVFHLRHRGSPARFLEAFNRIVCPDLERFGMYLTVLFGRVDLARNRFRYAAAGHCPPILVGPKGTVRFLETYDLMLGVYPDAEFTDFDAEFPPAWKLICYTDGLTDITDADGNLLGLTPLERICREFGTDSIRRILRRLMGHALENAPAGGLQDDVAIIGIERTSAPPRATPTGGDRGESARGRAAIETVEASSGRKSKPGGG